MVVMFKNIYEYSRYVNNMEYFFSRCKNEDDLKRELSKIELTDFEKKEYLESFRLYQYCEDGNIWNLIKFNKYPYLLRIHNVKNIPYVIKQISLAKSIGIKFDKILIEVENKTYDNIELLDDVEEEIYLKYHDSGMNLEEFKAMRATIDYYKSLVDDSMSPLEKLTFIYDIVKSFNYKENKEHALESRLIQLVLKNGNIVCVGFANLFSQILSELGFEVYIVRLKIGDGYHRQCLVKIDDDKYDIHEDCFFDPTFDSASSICKFKNKSGIITIKCLENKNEGEVVIKKYDDLILYNNFLVSFAFFSKKFYKAKIEKIMDLNNHIYGNEAFYSKIDEYVSEKDQNILSDKKLIELFYNVKIAEGYPKDFISSYIYDIFEVNNMLKKDTKDLIDEVVSSIHMG